MIGYLWGPSVLHNLDIVGAIFSFLSTFFYVVVSELSWPIGMLATMLNGTLYGLTGIYGDMALEGIYFFMMFYGWYEWHYGGKKQTKRPIQRLRWPLALFLVGIAVLGIALTYEVLKIYLHSEVALMDAVTTVLSLIAQWMICVKLLECWIVWFFVDAIYSVLYFDRHLPVHSSLLVIYLGMAVLGYCRWRWLYQRQCIQDF